MKSSQSVCVDEYDYREGVQRENCQKCDGKSSFCNLSEEAHYLHINSSYSFYEINFSYILKTLLGKKRAVGFENKQNTVIFRKGFGPENIEEHTQS